MQLKYRGLKDCVGGVAQPQITLEGISRVKLLVPSSKTLKIFNNTIISIFELKFNLENINENLRKTRDLLLPKLMSGEIEI